MSFEFKCTTEDDTPVVLRFKPYGDAPGRISRHNIGNMEAQVWQYLEWGLEDDQDASILDSIRQRDITKMYKEWQNAADDEPKKTRAKAAPKEDAEPKTIEG